MSAQAESNSSYLPVDLCVNGRKVSARPGQTILEVVRELDLDEIPTLCHDPRLEPYGSCFLCVVEVKGAPRLVPACVTRVRDGMEVTTRSNRIVHARKTALELLLSDHYADCKCTGHLACPAGVDIQGYLSLARLGYYGESLALVRERNPLPVVCGRVCVRKCEVKCLRNQVDEPVGINFIKRYVSEHAPEAPETARKVKATGKNVAVIGGGPAGLTCAYYLALKGHEVTIFEALPKLGGMLRYGIPAYRLPREELEQDIQRVLALGIKAEMRQTFGKDFTLASLLTEKGFNAVFLGMGAPLGKRMGLKGEDHVEGVESALDFLRQVELSGPPRLHGKVAVVGGGNSAIDAARTSLRCGAEEVALLYRRTRKEMPAHPEEVEAAEKEGVKLELLVAPLEIVAEEGRLRAVRCQRMELGEVDASGRRRPVPVKGSEFDYECDHLFAAIGQDTDFTSIQAEPESLRPLLRRGVTLDADLVTLATSIKGVFAGGDVVNGPSAVIDAVAHGRIAAEAMDRYLETGRVSKPESCFVSRRDFFGPFPDWQFADVEHSRRTIMPEREAQERIHDFDQVETGLAEPQMLLEAFRCMECGCKSAFECDLKRYSSEYGIDVSKYAGEVRRHRVDRSHPLITLDPNKCILCGRCIRTCSDIVGLAVLGFVGRGFATVVKPPLGRPLAESPCIACGSCVESCPTGALEARLPYGRQGPWNARRVPSVCSFCSLGCRLDLNVVSDGLLWATTPETLTPNSAELCLKGRFGTGFIQGSDRLRTPLVRENGNLREASLDEAIESAARILKSQLDSGDRGSIAIMAAPRMTLEEAVLVRHLAEAAMGNVEVGSFGQNRRGGPRHDLDRILGQTASTCVSEDVCSADFILLAGADPGTTHPVLAMAIRRAAKRGANVAAVNSSSIDLLRPGDLWLDARRGTAGILYAAVLNKLLESGVAETAGTRQDDLGLLKSSVAPATLERTADISGVSTTKIQALVQALTVAKKVVAIYDLDETLERATDDLSALAQILLLTGHFGSEGEGLLLLQSDCNSEGARLAGIANPIHLDRVRTALVILENPLADYRAAKGFMAMESLVVVDHFLTETGRMADVVLPAATLAESDGTVVSCDRKFIAVARGSRPRCGYSTAEVLAKLATALGHPVPSEDTSQIRADLASSLGATPSDLENARNRGLPLSRRPAQAKAFPALRLDPQASVGNIFPYATLDSVLDKKLADLGLVR